MKNTILQKLTLIIVSYNRQKLLLRAIKYWSNFDVKVIVLDGSDVALKSSNLNYKNIRYIHGPRSLHERLLNSLNYIETEFMILGTDDDFYLPSALSSCVKFLSKENEFSSCGGCAIGFNETKTKKIFGKQYYSKLINLTLDHSSSLSRVKKHFSNYVPAHTYSVIRSDAWKIISKYVFIGQNYFFSDEELEVEFLIPVAGKSKILPELMWMRNFGVPPAEGEKVRSKRIRIHQWWTKKKYQNQKLDFLKTMVKATNELLMKNDTKLHEDNISQIFEIYIKAILKNETFSDKIKKLIPEYIKRAGIVKFFHLVKNKFIISNHKSLKYEISLLESQGIRVNHKDLNKIISIITS